ncbi:MAG: hypothetical protein HDP28_04205 [Clostridia bacterium]|nr:hypothetical protein [Clostridia bacterium]
MEDEKNCKNCEYYVPHYVKRKTCFREIEGHCINEQLNKRYPRDMWKLRQPCDYWKPQKNKKEERKKTIKEVLRDMEKSLEDIKLILQSDEE